MEAMAGGVTPETVVLTRMSELFARGSSWHRRLWTVGTPLMLHEVSEYATSVRNGSMRVEGLQYVCSSAARQVARDRAMDCEAGREVIHDLLASQGPKGGLLDPSVAEAFGEHARRSQIGYLDRWTDQVATGGVDSSDAELVARLMAGHLLDEGFAPDHLHKWLRAHADGGLTQLLDNGAAMVKMPQRSYEVWVPYTRVPSQIRVQAGSRFMEHAAFLSMLDERGLPRPMVRAGAGVLRFDVMAREPRAALVAAELAVRRLRSRCVVGDPGERPAAPGPALVVNAGRPIWHSLPDQGRIFLPSLREYSGLFPEDASGSLVEDALELLASVETSTTWASLAAIWAALEGLLSRPGSREPGTAVADRAADLVTCSLPVAELRALQDEAGDGDYANLDGFLAEIGAGRWEADNLRSHAAILRLIGMSQDPHAVLGRVRGYFRDAFRRLYNQRNLVMHSGRFDSVALPAAMRTMPALVGAAVDRIVHGLAHHQPTSPLSLAARAGNQLDLVGSSGAPSITRLLD